MDDLIQSMRGAACDTTDDDAAYLLRHAADALEAAREDAERYRWLKANDNAHLLAEDVIDDQIAIDAAREARNG